MIVELCGNSIKIYDYEDDFYEIGLQESFLEKYISEIYYNIFWRQRSNQNGTGKG